MNMPTLVLLAFAGWTLLILFGTVGVYRWSRILTGRATVSEWQANKPQGSDGYQRAIAAHRNCIENLPVYTALVVAIAVFQVESTTLNVLSLVLLGARMAQSLVHIGFEQTEKVATWRFAFFFTQIVTMIWMGIEIVRNLP
ncbi:TPA: MAPEG family protein [Serratia marcescens]|uniref:MAPEG family protein n=1 Tax=Serratia TaxID=613 RepID=UPI0018D656DA|nr:MAPEG family protein [Serratia ureilytica]MBH2663565.1 MAPEG family protein [Serratia ureilytica]MBH3121770.1 MAPEG family protein [Serratia ureilytica]MBH3155547.1 MAPEG family protein [Serratia ureilytica]MBH3250639.1 MAPEG family protein [Serratia ureilytica]